MILEIIPIPYTNSEEKQDWIHAGISGDHFKLSRSNVVSLGEQVSSIFNRAPTLKFVLGALNTEVTRIIYKLLQ